MTKATGKQPKVYRLTMENFEIELDFLLEQLLTPSNHDNNNVITASGNKSTYHKMTQNMVTDTILVH